MLIECDAGTFGTNCSGTCGHCHKGQSFDKEMGACPKGCDSGYEGIYCNKSNISLNFDSSFVPYIFQWNILVRYSIVNNSSCKKVI